MNIWIPFNARNVLTGWWTASFSGRAWLPTVRYGSSKQNFRSRGLNAKWMLQIQNVCFFAYGWSWSEFFVMAAKSPGDSRLAFYIYFDLCALLDTAFVIVSMILPAKKMRRELWTESVRRKALWKMESYPQIYSLNLSSFFSLDLDLPIYSRWDRVLFCKQKKALWRTLRTVSRFLLCWCYVSYDELFLLTDKF